MSVQTLNLFLGLGAVGLQVVCLGILFLLFVTTGENKILAFVKKNFIQLGFFLALVPALASTFYSEVMNYAPCFHCWIQRIFLFPQVVLYGVAWMRKDANVFHYSWPLLLLGFIDALYLNYLYYFNPSSAPCDATGVSCAQQYVSALGGYISIPMLGLTSFASLLTLILVVKFYKK